MKNEFSSFDAAKILDLPMERLRQWLKLGFIKPTVPATGQGTKAVFTLDDLYGVALFKKLLDAGFTRTVAGEYVRQFLNKEKSTPERHIADYIIFKVFIEDGETKVCAIEHTKDAIDNINISTGLQRSIKPYMLSSMPKFKYMVSDAWDTLLVVNFGQIRKGIETALSGS